MVKLGKLAYMRGGYVQFSPKCAENCSPLFTLLYHLNIRLKMMLWCHATPCIIGYVCMLFSYEKITLKLHEIEDF